MNQSDDYILLCVKAKRYLTLRHDLGVSAITKDRQLFEAFRRIYQSKFKWGYRHFSLYNVQRIKFVKVCAKALSRPRLLTWASSSISALDAKLTI